MPNVAPPTLSEFLCGGERRVPPGAVAVDGSARLVGKAPRRPDCARRGSATRRCCSRSTVCACSPIPSGARARRRRDWSGRSASSRCRSRCARCRRSTSSSFRTITTITSTIRRCASSRGATCPSSRRSASARTWRPGACPPERIVELDWWESYTLPKADLTVTAAPSQHFSGRGAQGSQRDALVVAGHPLAPARGILQRRHGTHHRIRGDPRTPRSLRSRDARGRRFPSFVGPHPPRPGERA